MTKKQFLDHLSFWTWNLKCFQNDLLHDHDAYYCADTLITGPTKEIQPRLFEDNLIDQFLLMFDMQLKHRKKAFHDKTLRLWYEMIIFWVQSLSNLFYRLLLVVKNQPFRSFLNTTKLLRRRADFLLVWTITLILYPVLYPLLKLFAIVKGSLPPLRLWLRKKKREPAHWVNWFFR